MMTSFISAANQLKVEWQTQRLTGFTFNPHQPPGIIVGSLGERLLNVGVAGAALIAVLAETFNDRDVDAVFHLSGDRVEFRRWFASFEHTFKGTAPETAEQRALKAMDEQANCALYGLLGLATANPGPNGQQIGEWG